MPSRDLRRCLAAALAAIVLLAAAPHAHAQAADDEAAPPAEAGEAEDAGAAGAAGSSDTIEGEAPDAGTDADGEAEAVTDGDATEVDGDASEPAPEAEAADEVEAVDEPAPEAAPPEPVPPADPVAAPPALGLSHAYGGGFLDEPVPAPTDALSGLEIAGLSLLGVGVVTAATGGVVWSEVHEIGGQTTLGIGAGLGLTGITLIFVAAHLAEPTPDPAATEPPTEPLVPAIGPTPDGAGASLGLSGRW